MRSIVSIAFIAAVAGGSFDVAADTQLLGACVNRDSGEIRIAQPGQGCAHNSTFVILQTGVEAPPAPPPSGGSGFDVEYVTGGIYPGTSVARAFCPPGARR